jgi:hypothetical protein
MMEGIGLLLFTYGGQKTNVMSSEWYLIMDRNIQSHKKCGCFIICILFYSITYIHSSVPDRIE